MVTEIATMVLTTPVSSTITITLLRGPRSGAIQPEALQDQFEEATIITEEA